ncbi:transglycosylase domain-containing protein [Sphingomonas canadensis]|nr:transglycosylase domain-containing protein [Sphingomonas canadensis]MCW3837186.1 transglycosylase domain-containing protein [Sphingomonas canadensis]
MQPGGYTSNVPVLVLRKPRPWGRWIVRGLAGFIILMVVAIAWLALTAPLSKSLEPPAPPSITLLSAEGTPIARRGATIGDPVDAAKLPRYVTGAFVAIEDRRFYSHWGVDPRGVARAVVNNLTGGRQQGGSTITQQLAKNAFLDSSRTFTRKAQEAMISVWLEAWLSKDEILSRYLSNVYFGDNVYGLSAAAQHYFSTTPEKLTLSQATLLAGLVQAPSRLAPTGNLKGARERQKLVIAAMRDVGLITEAEAKAIRPAVLKPDRVKELPNGTYFADWVLPQARDRAGGVATEQTVRTTLEDRAQKAAERAVRAAAARGTQVALVAMHPDGSVIAMVGGRSYSESAFNRATQARRQPGSAFKLFVYLAALRSGFAPDSPVDDTPLTIGDWSPENSDGRYAGRITLAQAFAKSSNVVAARLFQKLGPEKVRQAARDLGISTPIGDDVTTALGTSTVSLLELTAAYAAVAEGAYPVRPRGLPELTEDQDWLGARLGGATRFPGGQLEDLRMLLSGVVESGTGRAARLSIPTFGKTGTTQDNRDALFVGYAGGIVAGVWIGNDDNSPNAALSGGGLPARIWRDFMARSLDIQAAPPPPVESNATEGNDTLGLEDALEGLVKGLDGVTTTEVVPLGPGEPTPRPSETPAAREDATTAPRRPSAPEPVRTPARTGP